MAKQCSFTHRVRGYALVNDMAIRTLLMPLMPLQIDDLVKNPVEQPWSTGFSSTSIVCSDTYAPLTAASGLHLATTWASPAPTTLAII